MTNIKIKNKISKEFGSCRFITCLTPNSFLKKIIVISTTFNFGDAEGETAISNINSLNYMEIDFNKLKWEPLKRHSNFKDALTFHGEVVSSKTFNDCKGVKE